MDHPPVEGKYHPADFNRGASDFKQIIYNEDEPNNPLDLKLSTNYLIRYRVIGELREDYIGTYIGTKHSSYFFHMLYIRDARSDDTDPYKEWKPFPGTFPSNSVPNHITDSIISSASISGEVKYKNIVKIHFNYLRPYRIIDDEREELDINRYVTIYSLGSYGQQISSKIGPNMIPELVATIDRLYDTVTYSPQQNKFETSKGLPNRTRVRKGLPSGTIAHIKGFLGDFSAGKKRRTNKRRTNKKKKRTNKRKHNKNRTNKKLI